MEEENWKLLKPNHYIKFVRRDLRLTEQDTIMRYQDNDQDVLPVLLYDLNRTFQSNLHNILTRIGICFDINDTLDLAQNYTLVVRFMTYKLNMRKLVDPVSDMLTGPEVPFFTLDGLEGCRIAKIIQEPAQQIQLNPHQVQEVAAIPQQQQQAVVPNPEPIAPQAIIPPQVNQIFQPNQLVQAHQQLPNIPIVQPIIPKVDKPIKPGKVPVKPKPHQAANPIKPQLQHIPCPTEIYKVLRKQGEPLRFPDFFQQQNEELLRIQNELRQKQQIDSKKKKPKKEIVQPPIVNQAEIIPLPPPILGNQGEGILSSISQHQPQYHDGFADVANQTPPYGRDSQQGLDLFQKIIEEDANKLVEKHEYSIEQEKFRKPSKLNRDDTKNNEAKQINPEEEQRIHMPHEPSEAQVKDEQIPEAKLLGEKRPRGRPPNLKNDELQVLNKDKRVKFDENQKQKCFMSEGDKEKLMEELQRHASSSSEQGMQQSQDAKKKRNRKNSSIERNLRSGDSVIENEQKGNRKSERKITDTSNRRTTIPQSSICIPLHPDLQAIANQENYNQDPEQEAMFQDFAEFARQLNSNKNHIYPTLLEFEQNVMDPLNAIFVKYGYELGGIIHRGFNDDFLNVSCRFCTTYKLKFSYERLMPVQEDQDFPENQIDYHKIIRQIKFLRYQHGLQHERTKNHPKKSEQMQGVLLADISEIQLSQDKKKHAAKAKKTKQIKKPEDGEDIF